MTKASPRGDVKMTTGDRLRDYTLRSKNYGKHVKTYSDRKLYEKMFRPLKGLDLKETDLLDLGCGIGLSSIHLKDKVKAVYYLDDSYEMINEGLKRGIIDPNNVIIHNFAKDPLPFDEERFDMIIARYCIHDVKDKLKLFTEIGRVLKPSGLFQVVDMYAIDELSRDFCNTIHSWKTHSDVPVDTFIDLLGTYENLPRKSGMTVVSINFYKSRVYTKEWVLENQITDERRKVIEQMALQEIGIHPSLKDIFGIKMSKGKGLCIEFPVVVMTAKKELHT
jgi:ubiquinone/menaquinone biosynthesis C-methylase UbiE